MTHFSKTLRNVCSVLLSKTFTDGRGMIIYDVHDTHVTQDIVLVSNNSSYECKVITVNPAKLHPVMALTCVSRAFW